MHEHLNIFLKVNDRKFHISNSFDFHEMFMEARLLEKKRHRVWRMWAEECTLIRMEIPEINIIKWFHRIYKTWTVNGLCRKGPS